MAIYNVALLYNVFGIVEAFFSTRNLKKTPPGPNVVKIHVL